MRVDLDQADYSICPMMRKWMTEIARLTGVLSLLGLALGCTGVPRTTEFDSALPRTEIDGFPFHTVVYGSETNPPVLFIHGGPGGDLEYLRPMKALAENYQVILYDQRGSGLSPRAPTDQLTVEQHLADLHSMVKHIGQGSPIRIVGHSWGGMLLVAYLGQHPEMIKAAVVIEPGMLYPESAVEFVKRMKEHQSFWAMLKFIPAFLAVPFIAEEDGHEPTDYVMTDILNGGASGPPYQCEGESLPEGSFVRGGYQAFDTLLASVMDDPGSFPLDLTEGSQRYKGPLLMISSECSVFGYDFQKEYHLPRLPQQTKHTLAPKMGHNMLTLNPEWSTKTIAEFFKAHRER
ncbi:MAG: alpha/beta hydrolase [Spirochaetaceae bacterium]|nr:alpha/beta hydrolase [Spirochaetaceae bacterium]|tara:strand:- start:51900 stop:52940 length:1041 start_codon:yes stop_codon:yes gene_type:complete